jgi:hypothetical protein
VGEDSLVRGNELLAGSDDDAHGALHQVVVLRHLLRSAALLNVVEESNENVLGEGTDIVAGEERLTALVLDEKNTFNRDSGVRVNDIVGGVEVLDEKGQNRDELLLGELGC